MSILPLISATKTLDKVQCLACDIIHPAFENGSFSICNDTVEHIRIIENADGTVEERTYQPVPFSFNIPAQTEGDPAQFGVTNIGLISSNELRAADNSLIDIEVDCWMIIADYDGQRAHWIDLGKYIWDTDQTETIELVSGTLIMKNCFDINAGRFRGKNPQIFINLNYR